MSQKPSGISEDVYVVTKKPHDEEREKRHETEKTSKSGVVLIPQSSDDPCDPLNWSWAKKHAVFLSVLPGCFLSHGAVTYGFTIFPQQAQTWNMSVQDVAQSASGGIFMQGPGGLIAVSLCERYGRLPVLFWSQILSLITTIGAAGSASYGGYTACRTLQGCFAGIAQMVGLAVIYDLFFFHDRARRINVWAFAVITGPLLFPLFSGLLVEVLGWRENLWVLVGMIGTSALLVALLGDETLFNRRPMSEQGHDKTAHSGLVYRAKLLTGVIGARSAKGRPTMSYIIKAQCQLILKPYFVLPLFAFTMPQTMWVIGLAVSSAQILLPPSEAHGYGFNETAYALMFFAPMIGNLAAEIFGHFQNDMIANFSIRRNAGKFVPEVRLFGTYIPWAIGVGGLILFGQALEYHLSWLGIAFGWAMVNFSNLAATTAISAYLVDVMPSYAALTGAWLQEALILGGFCVVYFQAPWIAKDGAAVAFGVQAAILGAAILAIISTQVFGRRWRKRFPPPPPLVL